MRIKTLIASTVLLAAQGCAQLDVNPESMPQVKPMPQLESAKPEVRSYVRISSPKHQILKQKTRVNRQSISIADALMAPKGLTKVQLIAKDGGVVLSKTVSLRVVDMTIQDYLKNLGTITNYDYQLDVSGDTPVIEIASMITREWNLAAISNMPDSEINAGLSATISSSIDDESDGSSGSGARLKITRDDDVWEKTIEQAKLILEQDLGSTSGNSFSPAEEMIGSEGLAIPDLMGGEGFSSPQTSSASSSAAAKGWLVENRRLGTITAYGTPNNIKLLDDWMSDMEKNMNRQIFLDVAILDVSTSKGDGRGVDWSAVYNNSGYQDGDTGIGSISLSGSNKDGGALSVVDGGTWALSTAGKVGSVSLNAIINALSEEGSVKLQSQPKLTVTNGYTAYLGATEEISYVSDIEILPVDSTDGGVGDPIVSTNLSRVSVGLKLAVTPRILKNGDILVEVVPIISTIKGFTEIDNGGQKIATPNIAMQELATQVITKSGKPIHLGGLILSRIIENAKRVPLPGGEATQALGELLGSMKIEEEGKELLIIITPTEVGS